ncbi:hypothetical protein ACTFIY_011880 [Dictyostelium cf. discoideum]
MNDLLFFKVWRNMVIRKKITGFKRLIIIKEKNEIYNNASSILKSMEIGELRNSLQIQFKNDLYFRLSSKLISLNKEVPNALILFFSLNDDENQILGYFCKDEIEKKRRNLQDLFNKNGVLLRKNSFLINEYINNLDSQSKTMSVMDILSREKKITKRMLKNINYKFKSEGLYIDGYKNQIKRFIENGGCIKEFVQNQIKIIKDKRISLLDIQFKKYGIDKNKLKYPYKYLEHINSFKPKGKKGVWSRGKIIIMERNHNYVHDDSDSE